MENEYLEQKKKKRDSIIGYTFLVWFLSSIVLMFILGESLYTVMVFGQAFFGFGLVSFFYIGKGDRLLTIPFMLVGLCCFFIPLFMMRPDLLSFEVDWDLVIVVLMLCGFLLAGVFTIYMTLRKRLYLKRVCTDEVNATVIGYDTTRSDKGNTLYAPIYGFWYNGKDWKVHNNSYSNVGVPDKGTTYILKVNPENPEEFYNEKSYGYLIGVFVGIFVIAFILPLLYYVLKNGLAG